MRFYHRNRRDDFHPRSVRTHSRVLLLLAALLLALFLVSFAFGRYGVPVWDVVRILGHRIGVLAEKGLGMLLQRPVHFLPDSVPWTAQMETVVINIPARHLVRRLRSFSEQQAGALRPRHSP